MKSTISRAQEILVAFITLTLLGEFCTDPASHSSRADIANLLGFAQDRCKRHGHTGPSLNLRWENFRWTGLGQKT